MEDSKLYVMQLVPSRLRASTASTVHTLLACCPSRAHGSEDTRKHESGARFPPPSACSRWFRLTSPALQIVTSQEIDNERASKWHPGHDLVLRSH